MIGYLASYAYLKSENIATLKSRIYDAPLFADSGAFSAKTLGITINTHLYSTWIAKNHDKFEVFANLDVINDPDATYANQKKIEAKGLKPMPVVHMGSSMDELKRYIDEGNDYIALGGLVGKSSNSDDVYKWIDDCFKEADGKAVFHGFGFTRPKDMTHWNWYSVDSSSWSSGGRYASARLFTGNNFVTIDLHNKVQIEKYKDLILDHNGEIDRFMSGNWHYRDADDLNVAAYYKYAEWWHGLTDDVVRVKTPGAVVGPIIYLAISNNRQASRAAFAIERYKRSRA